MLRLITPGFNLLQYSANPEFEVLDLGHTDHAEGGRVPLQANDVFADMLDPSVDELDSPPPSRPHYPARGAVSSSQELPLDPSPPPRRQGSSRSGRKRPGAVALKVSKRIRQYITEDDLEVEGDEKDDTFVPTGEFFGKYHSWVKYSFLWQVSWR